MSKDFCAPQLATLVDAAPEGTLWWHETKYDGYRMQAHTTAGQTTLYSRNALDWTVKFPLVVDALDAVSAGRQWIVDGEIVVRANGISSFHALQTALSLGDTSQARYMVFDLLGFDGLDIRSLPLSERRSALESLFRKLPASHRVQLSKLGRGTPKAALARACARGEEGIVCKRHDAAYVSGRAQSWVKVKCGKRQEFVVVGYTEPKGSRAGIGALLLGVYEGKRLRYAGRVGSGFSTAELGALRARLEKYALARTPLDASVDLASVRESNQVQWVKPTLVAEVSFTEWTADGHLRHPVYQGLRVDKKAAAVKREDK